MEPIDEMLRQSGQYGPKVEPPPGADATTRLMAFIGRPVMRPQSSSLCDLDRAEHSSGSRSPLSDRDGHVRPR